MNDRLAALGRINSGAAGLWVGAVCCALAGIAIALHSPGHMSMDTSMQLYEAMHARSISWNPPFMSALMRWLGGGEIATALLVFLCTGLVYAGFALTAAAVVDDDRSVALWRAVLAVLVVLNPIVAVYVGIVWKDVAFAAFLCGGVGFGFAAGRGSSARRLVCALVSTVLLAAGMLARQQGVFMAPLLLGVPIMMLAGGPTGARVRVRWLLIPVVFICAVQFLQHATQATIAGNAGRSTSVGYRSIMIFDMMGIVANTDRQPDTLAHPVPPEIFRSIRTIYRPSRIDTLDLDPAAGAWFAHMTPPEMRSAWLSLLLQNPRAYLHHRAMAYATLIGLEGMRDTLPVHIGVEGNREMLDAVGIPERRGPRDLLVYRVAVAFFDWPIYRHVFWIAMVAVCAVAVSRKRLPRPQRRATVLVLAAAGLLYLAYVPTMIAADFRYLFCGIPLVSIAMLPLLLGSGDRNPRPVRPGLAGRPVPDGALADTAHADTAPAAGARPRSGVALCSYNGARFLQEQLDSIAAQSEAPVCVAIVDDASTDGSWALVEAWAAAAPFPVRLQRNPANVGVVANFERAIELLGDDVDIVFLADQDDRWYVDKVATFVDAFAANPKLGLAHSDADLIDDTGRRIGRRLLQTLLTTPQELSCVASGRAWEVYSKRNLVTGAACAFRRSLLVHALPFSRLWMHDEWLAFIASLASEVRLLDRPTMAYRLHGANVVGVPIPTFGWRMRTTWQALVDPTASPQRVRAARLGEVLARAQRLDASSEALTYLQKAGVHSAFRGALPANPFRRWPLVVAEWKSGRYHQWSNGDISMAHDFLWPR